MDLWLTPSTVAGFAFDPRAGEESSALGRLTILQARISPDLLVAGLKATGAGHLFQVFGEPDIEIWTADNAQHPARSLRRDPVIEFSEERRALSVLDPFFAFYLAHSPAARGT